METTGISGFLSGVPVYRVEVSGRMFQRLVDLTFSRVAEVPDWLVMEGAIAGVGRRVIFTSDPSWFRNFFQEEEF